MDKKLPRAEWTGMLPVGGIEIPCFVLEDGRHLISGRGLTSTLGMKGRGQGVQRLTTSNPFKTALGGDIQVAIENPIHFVGKGSRLSGPTAGYPAETLIDVANALVDARNTGLLKTEQELRYAISADAIRTAFAKVGIIAVINEVTGYQEIKDREALTEILDKYLKKEHAKWAKRFPDEFYKLIFEMKGWRWKGMSVNRPSVVGRYTNDIVWARLAPGVLKELKTLNPKDEAGRRRVRHHQFLTEQLGHPRLQEHIHAAMALMRGSGRNWDRFMRSLQRAFPKVNTNLELPFDDD